MAASGVRRPSPGFTLLEILIGLALAGILALALMSLGNLSSRLTRTTYLSQSATSAQELVKMVLQDRRNCRAILQPMGLKYVPNGNTPITQDMKYVSNGQTVVVLQAPGSTTPDGLIVQKVFLADVPLPVPQAGYYTANLNIQFERYDPRQPLKPGNVNSSYGSPYATVMQIPLAISTDASGLISDCAGVSPDYGGTFTTYAQCDTGPTPPGSCPANFTHSGSGACKTGNQYTGGCSCPFGLTAYRSLTLTAVCWNGSIPSSSYYEMGAAPWPPQKSATAVPPQCGYNEYQCMH